MIFLFVGGPWDGRREDVNVSFESLYVAVRESWRISDAAVEPQHAQAKHARYDLRAFVVDDRTFEVFAVREMADRDVMAALLNGYRAPLEANHGQTPAG